MKKSSALELELELNLQLRQYWLVIHCEEMICESLQLPLLPMRRKKGHCRFPWLRLDQYRLPKSNSKRMRWWDR